MRGRADYSQPEFFRFGDDSLFLVREVTKLALRRPSYKMLELGIGSGVIACELSQRLPIASIHGVEAEEAWRPHLEENLQRFCLSSQKHINWLRVSEYNLRAAEKFDLIVCNPPYFIPERGRPSPDHRRNAAHRLVLDPWEAWLRCMERLLAPDGEAWFLQKDPGPGYGAPVITEGFELEQVARSGPMRVLRLRAAQPIAT